LYFRGDSNISTFRCRSISTTSQNVISDVLNNQELDLFKKANLALRYLSLIKGKDDIMQKSSDNLFRHTL